MLYTRRMDANDPRHGKPSTYSNHRCRCEACTAAWSTYYRERRLTERTPCESCGEKTSGILCRTCNVALGLFKDDPERILGLYSYMKKHSPGF